MAYIHSQWGDDKMSVPISRRGLTVLFAVGALLLAAFVAAPQAGAATIYACIKKKNGAARVFTKKPKCRKSEKLLFWNTEGPSGRNGKNGKNGSNGSTGKEGPTGKEGKGGLPGPFPGTLPQGITLRGDFNVGGTAANAGDIVEGDISFGFSFASAPTYHYVKAGGASTPECPGSATDPEAAPGNVCAYSTLAVNTEGLKTNTPNKWGDTVFVPAAAAGSFLDLGVWAATSP